MYNAKETLFNNEKAGVLWRIDEMEAKLCKKVYMMD